MTLELCARFMYDTRQQINSTRVPARMTVQNDKPVHADVPRPVNPVPAAAAQPADNAADAQSRCSDLKEVELPDVVI